LAFTVFGRNKLLKVNLSGGPPQVLCDSDSTAAGAWGSDGTILIGRLGEGLFRVSANDGAVTRMTTPDPSRNERRHTSPQFLPGGRQFLYVAASDKPGKSMLYAASLDSAKRTPVMPVESTVSFALSRYDGSRGYLLFSREGALFAQDFDLNRLRTIGDPFAIAERRCAARLLNFHTAFYRRKKPLDTVAGPDSDFPDPPSQTVAQRAHDRSTTRIEQDTIAGQLLPSPLLQIVFQPKVPERCLRFLHRLLGHAAVRGNIHCHCQSQVLCGRES
jgi:hypothetical protein